MLLTELQTYSLTHLASVPFSSSSSGDNSFSFITEKGLDVLELAPDPKSVSPSLSCRRYVIKPSTELPTVDLGISPSDLLPHLDRQEAYSLITDVTVSPRLVRTMTPTTAPRLALWSPVGILHNHRCVLAVLTDAGSLCLYVLSNNEYTKRVNVSALWLQHCKASWEPPDRDSQARLAELRNRAQVIKFTAMYWLEEVKERAGWLAIASKSGLVSLWKVRASDADSFDLNVSFVTQFDSELTVITTLHWTPLKSDQSLLTVAGLDGRLRCFILSYTSPADSMIIPDITADTAQGPVVVSTQEVWSEKDHIGTTHLTSWAWQAGLMLVAVKGAFVIMLYLNNKGERLGHAAYRCCDTSVNGLTQLSADELLIVTRSSRFTRLTVSLTAKNSLVIKTSSVESYINITHMGCYGLNMTQNKVICFILLSVNQSYDHLRLREPSQVVVCSVSGLLEPQTVLQNPHRPVSQLWDCLELLRVQMLQKVVVSEVSYPRVVLDSMTIDQLTITLWWASFAAAAEEDESKHKALLSLRCEVETLVISCHFFKRIALLLGYKSLSAFQLHSLGLLHKWLTQLQDLPEEFSTTLITGKTLLQQLKALDNQIPSEELCSICGTVVANLQELFFSECGNGHRMPRCSLSLVQCSQLPYFVCAHCGALAHPLAVKECGVSCNLCGGVLRIDEEIL